MIEQAPLSVHPMRPISSHWRRIVTPIPAPQSLVGIERLRRLEPRSMSGMPPVLWHEAEGFLVRDPYGNQWIDLTSGIVMANAGHAHPRICQAIHRAVERKLLATYAFPTEIRQALLETLVQLSPIADAKAILYSSGTEATESAIMLMRRHGQTIHRTKVGILSFRDGFHGRTLAAAMAAGSPRESDWIRREQLHHHQIPFPFCPRNPWKQGRNEPCDGACFEQSVRQLQQDGIQPQHIAGIIVEPMPGWATWPMPTEFAHAMSAWARQHDILLCFDEVQSGCGRSGRFFAHEYCGIVPDLITLGKGLSSSLPVSAVIGSRRLLDLPLPGEMSSTHGGNPVCAAAALENLRVIEDERLVEASRNTGRLVLDKLQTVARDWPRHVLSIHGRGLFISIHLKRPDTGEPDVELADAAALEAVRRGVMMFTTGRGFLKFTPPLCIDPQAAIEAADVIGEVCRDLISQRSTTCV